MGNRMSGGVLKLPIVSGGSNGGMYTIILAICDRFPPTAPDRFGQVRGAFTPFSPEIGSSLGSGYDCSGLYIIHGVVRG